MLPLPSTSAHVAAKSAAAAAQTAATGASTSRPGHAALATLRSRRRAGRPGMARSQGSRRNGPAQRASSRGRRRVAHATTRARAEARRGTGSGVLRAALVAAAGGLQPRHRGLGIAARDNGACVAVAHAAQGTIAARMPKRLGRWMRGREAKLRPAVVRRGLQSTAWERTARGLRNLSQARKGQIRLLQMAEGRARTQVGTSTPTVGCASRA
eukprot:363097-Chlamydomonas_euryale.AAC.4